MRVILKGGKERERERDREREKEREKERERKRERERVFLKMYAQILSYLREHQRCSCSHCKKTSKLCFEYKFIFTRNKITFEQSMPEPIL